MTVLAKCGFLCLIFTASASEDDTKGNTVDVKSRIFTVSTTHTLTYKSNDTFGVSDAAGYIRIYWEFQSK